MKRKLWLTALIPLLIIGLLLIGVGCPTPKSGSTTTTEDVQDQLDAYGDVIADIQDDIEDINDTLDELGGVSQSDIDNLMESINKLTSTVNTVVSDMQTIKDDVADLKAGDGGNTPPPTTGLVTIGISAGQEMISANTVWLLSVTNGTTEFKKVYISAMLTAQSSASSNVASAAFTGSSPMSSTAFNTPSYFPSQASCTMIQSISVGYLLMAPGANKVPVTVSLNFACTPAIFWNVAFSPIVTSY